MEGKVGFILLYFYKVSEFEIKSSLFNKSNMFCPGDLQETGHLHSLAIAKINLSSSVYYIVTGIVLCLKKIEN